MVKTDRLLSKKEKEYVLRKLRELEGKEKTSDQEKLKKIINSLKEGLMTKETFAEFINILDFLAFNQEPKDYSEYTSKELLDKELEKIHQKLEIKFNKFFGISPDKFTNSKGS